MCFYTCTPVVSVKRILDEWWMRRRPTQTCLAVAFCGVLAVQPRFRYRFEAASGGAGLMVQSWAKLISLGVMVRRHG